MVLSQTAENRPDNLMAGGVRRKELGLVALLAALFLIPLIIPYHSLPNTLFYQDWLALFSAALLITFATYKFARSGLTTIQLPVVVVVPLGFAAIIVLQYFIGQVLYLQDMVFAATGLLLASGLASVGFNFTKRFDVAFLARALAWTALANGVAQCLWGGVQLAGYDFVWRSFLTHAQDGHPFRLGGTIGQSNMTAASLVWALLGLRYLYVSRFIRPAASLATAFLFLVALSMTGSRSPYLYLLVGVPAIALICWRKTSLHAETWPVGIALVFPIVDVLVHWVVEHALPARLALRPLDTSTIEARGTLGRDAVQLFLDAPVLGQGWGTFAGARFTGSVGKLIELNNDNAHNIF